MKRFWTLVCVVALLLLMPATVSAKVIRTPFISWVVGYEVLDEGTWTYPGGRQHYRGMVELLTINSENRLFVGQRRIVANGNLDAAGLGHVWGTYHMDIHEVDGYWEGTWHGEFTEAGIVAKMRGRGYGDLAGMRIQGTAAMDEFGVLSTTGVIIELPHR